MFSQYEIASSSTNQPVNPLKQTMLAFSHKKSKADRERKIYNLRQIGMSDTINWHQPI